MSHPNEPLNEHPSTYVVQDRKSLEEIARLEIQDKLFTAGMGGVLPELTDPTTLRQVLDVGCGTGGWLIETAQTYPTIEKLVGADISSTIVAHARAKAEALGLDGRVEFRTMDALRLLEFPSASFDLVNQRFGVSWLRTWEWTKILSEYQRVTRPGGIIRITDSDFTGECNSPALMKLWEILLETSHRSGRLFSATRDGVTGHIPRLMTQHGIQNIQTRVHILVHEAGTEAGRYLYEDMAHLFRLFLPFFHKWTRVPSDYEEIYQQALKEMQQPNFVARGNLLTAWGTRPL
jgi:ubiquinone/menaquinone biosynthesis C-methylase UbiE